MSLLGTATTAASSDYLTIRRKVHKRSPFMKLKDGSMKRTEKRMVGVNVRCLVLKEQRAGT